MQLCCWKFSHKECFKNASVLKHFWGVWSPRTRTKTCLSRTRTRTCKLVLEDPQRQGLSSRTATLILLLFIVTMYEYCRDAFCFEEHCSSLPHVATNVHRSLTHDIQLVALVFSLFLQSGREFYMPSFCRVYVIYCSQSIALLVCSWKINTVVWSQMWYTDNSDITSCQCMCWQCAFINSYKQ